jgi:hypothetical protein
VEPKYIHIPPLKKVEPKYIHIPPEKRWSQNISTFHLKKGGAKIYPPFRKMNKKFVGLAPPLEKVEKKYILYTYKGC